MVSIAVVGSTNIDMVAYSDQIPERGETVTGKDFAIGFGGKGANQAVMAARLGIKTYMVGAVGDDVFGQSAIKNFTDQGVNTEYLATVSGARNGTRSGRPSAGALARPCGPGSRARRGRAASTRRAAPTAQIAACPILPAPRAAPRTARALRRRRGRRAATSGRASGDA